MHDYARLKELQALPLERKVGFTAARICEWYTHWEGKVYVSFSGGKDSTVLLHIARALYPDIPAVFCDTGLEYPEVKQFVGTFENVEYLRPRKSFYDLLLEFGYPVVSKMVSDTIQRTRGNPTGYYSRKLDPNSDVSQKAGGIYNFSKYKYLLDAPFKISSYCCRVLKKNPSGVYERRTGRKAIIGMLATEGVERRRQWIKHGCNAFGKTKPTSNPLSFWTEQDILKYAYLKGIKFASIYGDLIKTGEDTYKLTGAQRTGCVFCLFGAHLDCRKGGEARMEILKRTHPKLWEYCIKGGEIINGMIQPTKKGLGMGKVLDWLKIPYGGENEQQ